jgi:hypothetical protein
MATRTPPRYVPTLTEVVPGTAPARETSTPSQQELVHRIMQRIDLTLDKRLREAIASVVLEHSRALAPALREEVEAVVGAIVAEALADELVTEARSGGAPLRPGP